MKSSRQLPAPTKTPAMLGPGCGLSLCGDLRCDRGEHLAEGTKELVAGADWREVVPELTQRRIARSSAFLGGAAVRRLPGWLAACERACIWLLALARWRRRCPAASSGRPAALASSLAEGCVQVGRSFFNAPRVMLVYCMRPFGMTWSGWPTMQVRCVGGVADVAVLDEDALAVADVGRADGDVLRGGGGGEDGKDGRDAQDRGGCGRDGFIGNPRFSSVRVSPMALR